MRVVNDSKAADAPRSVVYRSATPLLDIAPNNERKLGLGGLAEAAARLRPGTKVGQHKMVVTCVECTSNRLCQREILWSWMVSATVAAPHISQHYEALGLPDDREKRVKIRFENKHASTKNFMVSSHALLRHDSACVLTRARFETVAHGSAFRSPSAEGPAHAVVRQLRLYRVGLSTAAGGHANRRHGVRQ